MTQQPYAPPGYPQAPPQQYQPPVQPQYPVAPQQAYPPQPQAQFPQYPAQQQQAPAVPLANGTLDDFYSQPSASGGPSISWRGKPIGTTVYAVVARDVTNGDVQQQTDPASGQPKFYRDGRPMFVMKVPLKVEQSAEFPQGEATWFVRGQARDELNRAMAEAQAEGAPKAGALLSVQLVEQRPSRMGNPANIFRVSYQPGQGSGAPSPAPEQAQPVAPVDFAQLQAQAYAVQGQLAQGGVPSGPLPPVPDQGYVPGAQPLQAPPEWAQAQQAPLQPQAPAQPVAQGGAAMPAGLNPDQQALFAKLTNGQAQG